MIFTFRRSNSGLTFAMYPSSVVQTGVKSLGCENSTAHESPIHSWKRTGPSDVSASKSGAVSPIRNTASVATAVMSAPPFCPFAWASIAQPHQPRIVASPKLDPQGLNLWGARLGVATMCASPDPRILFRVTSQSFHLALDVVVKDDQLRGQVGDGVSQPKPFSGWLGLIAALDGLLGTGSHNADLDDKPCT